MVKSRSPCSVQCDGGGKEGVREVVYECVKRASNGYDDCRRKEKQKCRGECGSLAWKYEFGPVRCEPLFSTISPHQIIKISSFIQCLGSCAQGGTQNQTAYCTSNGIRVDQVHCRHLNLSNTEYQSCQMPGCGEISNENDASPTIFNTNSISLGMIAAIVSVILIILIVIIYYFLWKKETLANAYSLLMKRRLENIVLFFSGNVMSKK